MQGKHLTSCTILPVSMLPFLVLLFSVFCLKISLKIFEEEFGRKTHLAVLGFYYWLYSGIIPNRPGPNRLQASYGMLKIKYLSAMYKAINPSDSGTILLAKFVSSLRHLWNLISFLLIFHRNHQWNNVIMKFGEVLFNGLFNFFQSI